MERSRIVTAALVLASLAAIALAWLFVRRPSPEVPTSEWIAADVRLSVEADPGGGSEFWAVLNRDGGEEFVVERVRAGAPNAIAWREAVRPPRDWKLKFGPTRHPTYQMILLPGGGTKPAVLRPDVEKFHDPRQALAIAYFAVPLDGEKELRVSLRKPEPLDVRVVGEAGAPLKDVPVVGIATPRYVFADGLDPERVDVLYRSWPWAFWNLDHVPNHGVAPHRVVRATTDAQGKCRFDGFVGWVGVPEKEERFALPRDLLAMPDVRSARFAVVRNPARVALKLDGQPGLDYHATERGLLLEGDWPVPDGFKPARWAERLPFIQSPTAEVFTPCREVRVQSLSPVHRVAEGEVVSDLRPGETRAHRIRLEERPHLKIEGEVLLEGRASFGQEHCTVELYEAGDAGRLVRPAGSLNGPGVPQDGRVTFAFHVAAEGPYTIAVRAGNYPSALIRDVRAPRSGLSVRLSPEKRNLPCALRVTDASGRDVKDFVVGTWPHRELVTEFISGASAKGKPGMNTFVIHSSAGSALLRDVELRQESPTSLAATLSPGRTVAGRVVDSQGRPVARQWVHLSWPGFYRMSNAFRWLSDLTGEDGRFEIRQVPAGPWRLYARETGIPLGASFNVAEGSGSQDLGDRIAPN